MSFVKSEIKKILVISLSNIGDVILTFPVIDILKHDFPQAKLTVVIGPKAAGLLLGNPHFEKIEVFDKHQATKKTVEWVLHLTKENFDLVVDLRNTAIPLVLKPKYKTSLFIKKNTDLHMKEKHLKRLKSVYPYQSLSPQRFCLHVSGKDKAFVQKLISDEVGNKEKFIIVAPGAANRDKRWTEEGFALLCDQIMKIYHSKIVFVGDWEDKKVSCRIAEMMEQRAVNFCGRTNLLQLIEIFQSSFLTIVNDSASLHMASYLNIPVLAIFGPTNPKLYGPWGNVHAYIQKNKNCEKCRHPKRNALHKCMQAISADDVFSALMTMYPPGLR